MKIVIGSWNKCTNRFWIIVTVGISYESLQSGELEDIYDKNGKSKFHLNYIHFSFISSLNIKYVLSIYVNNNEIQFHEIIINFMKFYLNRIGRYKLYRYKVKFFFNKVSERKTYLYNGSIEEKAVSTSAFVSIDTMRVNFNQRRNIRAISKWRYSLYLLSFYFSFSTQFFSTRFLALPL